MTEIVHNVADRRNDWIGPWEIESEPLDISKLWAGDEGRTVIYRGYGRAEAGTLSSWTATTVFVRFHKGDTAAGCSAGSLHFAKTENTGSVPQGTTSAGRQASPNHTLPTDTPRR